jgi:hypothetical protein
MRMNISLLSPLNILKSKKNQNNQIRKITVNQRNQRSKTIYIAEGDAKFIIFGKTNHPCVL